MALFDERYPAGLLNEHIRAVAGCLGPEVRQNGRALGGFQIVYANQTGVIGDSLVWPVWVKDRPAPGSRISIDDPLCTVTAKGDSIVAVRELLAKRGQLIGASCFA
jgi:predicted ATP-grasp superfamily ATP-dependent carboligase